MHNEITKLMERTEEVNRIKETLVCWAKEEINSGKDCVHLESLGQTIDMIKDLAEAEKEYAESLYYKLVASAMTDAENSTYGENMGYNHRHLRNGEFARSGRGHMVYGDNRSTSGFHHGPFVDQEDYIDGYLHDPNEFRRSMRANMGYENDRFDRMDSKSKYGKAYDDYQEARRHYTVSKEPADKERMDHHTMEHVNNTLESMQEMWESSDDVMLKKRIVDEASRVLNQMKAAMGTK